MSVQRKSCSSTQKQLWTGTSSWSNLKKTTTSNENRLNRSKKHTKTKFILGNCKKPHKKFKNSTPLWKYIEMKLSCRMKHIKTMMSSFIQKKQFSSLGISRQSYLQRTKKEEKIWGESKGWDWKRWIRWKGKRKWSSCKRNCKSLKQSRSIEKQLQRSNF